MSAARDLRESTRQSSHNLESVRDAMTAISKATNTVPITRIEWLAVCFICSQTIGNLALLGIAVALLRGHVA